MQQKQKGMGMVSLTSGSSLCSSSMYQQQHYFGVEEEFSTIFCVCCVTEEEERKHKREEKSTSMEGKRKRGRPRKIRQEEAAVDPLLPLEKRKRGRPRKIRQGKGKGEPAHFTHSQRVIPNSPPPLPMGKRKRGRPRKIRKREAPLGKRKRERPGKISLGQAEEREGDSGQLTPTAVDSIIHHQRIDPTSTPPEFLSELVHHPPVPSRYPTQHGEIKSANEITSDSSDLTPAKWVLAETIDSLSLDNEDIPNLEKFTSKLNVQNQVSNTPVASSRSSSQDLRTARCHTSTPWLAKDFSVVTKKKWFAKKGKIIEDNGSVSAASEDQSIPTTNGLLNIKKFASELLHQSWGLEKIQAAAPPSAQHDVVLNNDLSNRKANVEPKGEPIRSLSLDLTEMVAMLNDDASDAAEVRSALDPALVTVNGYTVKEEFASLLRDIFSKYGDIAKASSLRTMRSRSSFLEIVCGVFQMLKRAKFTEITPTELKCMLDLIADVEFARVEIGWLHKRLNEIYEANVLFKSSSFLKEAKTSITEVFKQTEKEVEGYKAEMLMLKEKMLILQEKISLAEEKMATMKAESEKINEAALDTKTKVKCFYERSLVDGLL